MAAEPSAGKADAAGARTRFISASSFPCSSRKKKTPRQTIRSRRSSGRASGTRGVGNISIGVDRRVRSASHQKRCAQARVCQGRSLRCCVGNIFNSSRPVPPEKQPTSSILRQGCCGAHALPPAAQGRDRRGPQRRLMARMTSVSIRLLLRSQSILIASPQLSVFFGLPFSSNCS